MGAILVPEYGLVASSSTPQLQIQTSPIDAMLATLRDPPLDWVTWLRNVSPVSSVVSWLDFRWMAEAERWVLYECVPAGGVPREKVAQLERPWWTMPKDQQMGRKVSVSTYQLYRWQQDKVWARPCWVLQGWHGGTPARYTAMETEILRAEGKSTSVPPAGLLPFCGFDSRVVRAIRKRDRLIKAGGSVDRLRALAEGTAVEAEYQEAQKAFRKTFLEWWEVEMSPMADFLEWYTRQSESQQTLRPPTMQELNAGARLKDEFLDTGVVPFAPDPTSLIS